MKVMLSCGEPSGDVYAGALVEALRRRDPAVEAFGFGGQHFRSAGGHLVGDFSGFSVTGLTEALRVIPRSLAMLRRLTAAAREMRPDVFVAIDFPDFNFRLMAQMHRLGIPVVYYVSPQLWAWRPGRMKTMKRYVDRVLVIFPFEAAIYANAGVAAEFVGHPLVDTIRTGPPRADFLRDHGLSATAPTVALLPGSRRNELHRIVPTMAEALPLIRERVPDVQFVVACAPNLPEALFAPLVAAGGKVHLKLAPTKVDPTRADGTREDATGVDAVATASDSRPALVHGRTDDVLAACDVVITASGTATVQCALHERPMVVVYQLSPMSYRLGRPFVKVDTYAMPNLVAGTRVVPELIQDDFTAANVAAETISLLTDRGRYAGMQAGLRRVRERLGAPGASTRAADAVIAVARARRPGR